MAIRLVLGLSGGLDSTVLLHSAIKGHGFKPDEIKLVTFQYGSKHNQLEATASEHVRQWMSIPLINRVAVGLDGVFWAANTGSALLSSGGEIPEGHYNDETMRQTVVPGRNLLFLAAMAAIAEAEAIKSDRRVVVWLGVHAGDHLIYPDCRPEFIENVGAAVRTSTEFKVSVEAPFVHLTKKDIVQLGLALGSPFGLTRTCYTSHPVACGKCGSCRERLEAFALNGREDFIEYQSEAK